MSEKQFELSPSLAIIIAGVVVAGAIVFTNTRGGSVAQQGQNGGPPAPVAAHVSAPTAEDHIIGSPNAPVVLIEYSDFECPFCSRVHPTLKQLVDQSNGQIAWVMRNLPLESIHPEANPAANAAECIAEQLGNGGWWKFADTIFADQSKMNAAYYEQLAVQFGADKTTYKSCVTAAKYQSKIDAQESEAMQNGGQGTPYTVVYSKKGQKGVSGAVPLETFQSVIDQLK